jgi:hypothetical protein
MAYTIISPKFNLSVFNLLVLILKKHKQKKFCLFQRQKKGDKKFVYQILIQNFCFWQSVQIIYYYLRGCDVSMMTIILLLNINKKN